MNNCFGGLLVCFFLVNAQPCTSAEGGRYFPGWNDLWSLLPFQFDQRAEDRVAKGHDMYLSLQENAAKEKCWTQAILLFDEGCRGMNEETKGRLAVALTNCHLMRSGMDPFLCSSDMSILECTSPMTKDPIAFNTFTEFFLHAENVCYYLQSEYFQQRTEEAVNVLAQATHRSVYALEEVRSMTASVQRTAEETAAAQQKIQDGQEELMSGLLQVHSQTKENFRLFDHEMKLLESLSVKIHSGVEQSIRTQDHMLEGQYHLQQQQQQMSRLTAAALNQLKEDSTFLKQDLKFALENQRDLLRSQDSLQQGFGGLKDGQEEIAETQQRFFEEQAQLYRHAEEKLTSIASASERANEQFLEMIQKQETTFANTFNFMNELSSRSEAALFNIETQHGRIASMQGELLSTVERLGSFHRSLLGEFFDLKAIAYYLSFAIVGFLATSSPATNAARLFIFLALPFNFLLEKFIFAAFGGFEEENSETLLFFLFSFPSFSSAIWFLRKCCCVFCAIAVIVAKLSYRDYLSENNRLLHQLCNSHAEILGRMKRHDDLLQRLEDYHSRLQRQHQTKHHRHVKKSKPTPKVQ
ncbi:TRP domain-containing protein [Balamuthia mandrillaris]